MAALGTARGSFLRSWRLLAIDGFEVDLPDSGANAAGFGYAGSGDNRSAFPKARVVAISECGTHAFVAAEIGDYATGERTLAARLYPRLRADELLIVVEAIATRSSRPTPTASRPAASSRARASTCRHVSDIQPPPAGARNASRSGNRCTHARNTAPNDCASEAAASIPFDCCVIAPACRTRDSVRPWRGSPSRRCPGEPQQAGASDGVAHQPAGHVVAAADVSPA